MTDKLSPVQEALRFALWNSTDMQPWEVEFITGATERLHAAGFAIVPKVPEPERVERGAIAYVNTVADILKRTGSIDKSNRAEVMGAAYTAMVGKGGADG